MYVIGFSPSIETLSLYVNYELELRKINEKDYRKEIKMSKEAIEKLANSKNMTYDEYIEFLINEMKENDIKKIKKKYRIFEENSDFIDENKEKFNKIIENFISKFKYE